MAVGTLATGTNTLVTSSVVTETQPWCKIVRGLFVGIVVFWLRS